MLVNKKKKDKKTPIEFSKLLLIQESILIWVITISFIILAFVCIASGFFGELPWLAAMATFPWTAYGATQAFYYKKAEKENTKNGIKYETVMAQMKTNDNDTPMSPKECSDNAVG